MITRRVFLSQAGLLGVASASMPGIDAFAATQEQRPTFSTRREVVRVDVMVTDDGREVKGLTAKDFEVFDEGVLQEVDLVLSEEVPINVILALDLSYSVSGERLGHLRGAGRAVVEGLTPRDAGALVTFSHVVTLRQDLTQDLSRLRTAIDRATPEGRTALHDATYTALLLGDADPGRDLLMVFSDGRDTSSWLTPALVMESARRADATVYSVTVRGGDGDTAFLDDLGELTGGRRVEISSTTDLQRTFVAILEEFRNRYFLSYSPRGVSKPGWHRVQVRVKGRRAAVRARAGYDAGS